MNYCVFAATTSTCPATAFACADGSGCVPGYEVCNAQLACTDGSDEEPGLCLPPRRWRFLIGGGGGGGGDRCPFRCANGHCRATDVVCSGSDGCGDDSDERLCHICS